jgi:hypothetical protein
MRAFQSGAAAILVAAALAGCAERSATTAKTGVEWLDRDNTPVNVKLTFDSTNAASATIGEEGGVVSTSTSDGSYFELEIPKGALRRREKITMIPVTRVDGLPLEKGGAVASVQLEPEGLRFDKPVKLTIEPANPVPVPEQVSFAWITQGTDTHLYPATGDSLAMEMQLLHFSGYGFGKAPPGDRGRIHLLYAAHHAARLEAQLQQAIHAEHERQVNGEEPDGSVNETTRRVMDEYYDAIVKPTMKIAETDEKMAECAIRFFIDWRRTSELMGLIPDREGDWTPEGEPTPQVMRRDPDMVNRMMEAHASLVAILENLKKHVMDRAKKECKEQHDLTAVQRLISMYRMLALFGMDEGDGGTNFAEVISEMEACNQFEVELSSSIDSRLPSGASHFTLSSTAKYAPADGRQEAPLNYVSLEISGRPWKDVMDAMSGGHGAQLLQKRDGNFLRLMDFTVSKRGARHGTVTVEKVDWKVVERDTVGTSCAGADEDQKTEAADSMEVTLRIDPPTEIVHFVSDAVPAFNDDMHEWMRFFMQFRKAAGHEPTFVPGANPDDDSGAQPEVVTVLLKQQSPGVWSTDFRTPEGVTSEGLSETGHLILRHTPK